MSFKNVYNALYDQISAYPPLTSYVNSTQFLKGFKQNIPNQEYTIILEPGNEEEIDPVQTYNKLKEFVYNIDIYARTILPDVGGIGGIITGHDNKKGVLEFIDDIKNAIRSDLELGYNRKGSSVSTENIETSFTLSPTEKYISVSINSKTPVGYDSINCGSSLLTGTVIAANIQTALRALGNVNGDGYNDAICTFDNTTKKFTITSNNYCPKSSVVVTAGTSDDCSELLGFDAPTEVSGRNIVKILFGTVTTNNEAFPVRYRILGIRITEEVLI